MPDDPLAGVTLTRFQAAIAFAGSPYVVGPTYARKRIPRFEFKRGATGYTGGGYPRLRSWEHGPESGHGSNDVFVPVHRLAALVWCYDGVPIGEALADLREKDVHHLLAMPSANGPEWVDTRDHGDHSRVTQTQMRAWAEDAKRQAEKAKRGELDRETCASPGCGAEPQARVAGERWCIECASENASGETIEIL